MSERRNEPRRTENRGTVSLTVSLYYTQLYCNSQIQCFFLNEDKMLN